MPELAEVETVRNVLLSWVKGKTIRNIKCFYPLALEGFDIDIMNACLNNKKIEDIYRHGKYLIFKIEDYALISHLRMEGKYFYYQDYKYSRHNHVLFELDDNSTLAYNDTRKFGRFNLVKFDTLDKFMETKVGPEPFDAKPEYLYEIAKNYKGTLKEFLLDQHVMAGLGNIYCDEVLFDLKLSPFEKANILDIELCSKVIESSIKILNKAIKLGGSTIHSFSFNNGVDGRFQNELNAYGRENKECVRCKSLLVKTLVATRSTIFCPYCQSKIDIKKPKLIGITGLISSGKTHISKLFKDYGYTILNSDEIVKFAYNDEAIKQKLLKTFGFDCKEKIRDIVKNNKDKLNELEDIIHPYVINYINNNLKDYTVVEIPLLFETKLNKLMDFNIMVVCDNSVRMNRLKARNPNNYRDYLTLNNDLEGSYKKVKQANYVINTTIGDDDSIRQVKMLMERFR